MYSIELLNEFNEKGDIHAILYNGVMLYVYLMKAGDWQMRMGKKNTHARNKETIYQEIDETLKGISGSNHNKLKK